MHKLNRNYLKFIEVTNTFPQYCTIQYIKEHQKYDFDLVMSSYSSIFCIFMGFIQDSLKTKKKT